jgi:hypothetical protein
MCGRPYPHPNPVSQNKGNFNLGSPGRSFAHVYFIRIAVDHFTLHHTNINEGLRIAAMQRHSVERISHPLHAFSMRLVEIFNHRSAGITPRESLVFCVTLLASFVKLLCLRIPLLLPLISRPTLTSYPLSDI